MTFKYDKLKGTDPDLIALREDGRVKESDGSAICGHCGMRVPKGCSMVQTDSGLWVSADCLFY